jgi:polyhydroxybutyrate depolymerase
MKKILLIFALGIMSVVQTNAQFTNKTMLFGGLNRSYRIYVSPNYNAANPASLLIALHGMGDNMTNFSTIGFHLIADTANIICVYPQAVSDIYAGTAWNSSAGQYGYYPNSSVNDIGFINAIVDTCKANYSIDHTRVYLCGFSMGGFMTERMALQSNSNFAAFGSMSGTFGSGITTFNPGRHVPIAHFHGTADSTVYYTGNLYGEDPEPMVDFWVTNNVCDTPAVVYNYPHTSSDSITVERYEYSNGDPNSDVWFFKMYNASHTVLYQPGDDITEIVELWYFFRAHTYAVAGISDQPGFTSTIEIFPNPCSDVLTVNISGKATVEILTMEGQVLKSTELNDTHTTIDISDFAAGVYLVKVKNESNIAVKKFVKE